MAGTPRSLARRGAGGRLIREAAQRIAAASPPGPDEPSIRPQIDALRETGLLAACAPAAIGGRGLAHEPERPQDLVEALAAIGGANLSAGRLFEGHVNAVKLVVLYGDGRADEWLRDAVRGCLFGVWGADGPNPVRIRDGHLQGQKLYASGADILDRAVVSARDEEGRQRLLLLHVDRLEGRLHPAEWSTTGMRSTASGRCDLHGLRVSEDDFLGPPDVYEREPHFRGGVWRYAAVQLGAMREMTRATAAHLGSRGQTAAPLQAMRLRRMVTACETSRLWVIRAAEAVEEPGAPPSAAATAILSRLAVLDEARALLGAMDDALGAASFAASHAVERRRRDLMFYIRQATPDAMGDAALDVLRSDPGLARAWNLG